ncbi:cDP-diacylglycerol--glycerol-3-phosphate 3-phosphatidyltransferase [Firmicutes bacterium CAG:345]|jgi:CDP-diacylglycerol--glycerol-3-phosphate 3-phosphatidyltransferase|nr:cDP-diacylglycerol--glycerol-3-phosphate 3-phosphatidyltransferase [Firmicutes bacterium CAG:345]
MNLPNKITISRLIIAVIMIFFAVFPWANVGASSILTTLGNTGFTILDLILAILFVVGSATDAIDGKIARKYNLITDFGKFFDPLADKFLVNSALIFLACYGRIPALIIILMIGRDLAVDGIRFMAASKGEVIAANIFGKLKTVFQMVTIPFVMLNGFPFNYLFKEHTYIFLDVLLSITCAMSLISGFIYLYRGRKYIQCAK